MSSHAFAPIFAFVKNGASAVESSLTVAEYFAGIGLMRLGLERAGWRVVWANDIDAEKRAMYRGHFCDDPEEHFHLGDVHSLQPGDVPPTLLATASFPCNDLSLAGARRGLAGAHSSAFWGFIHALEGLGAQKPRIVLLENVAGFLTSNSGEDFRSVCMALNALGYEVDAFLIDAAHFVPQSRVRMFVVGVQASGNAKVSEESPSFFQGPGRPAALADFIAWHPEIRWAIRPLPELPSMTHHVREIVEPLSPNSSLWWSRERAAYLLGQMSPRHRRLADAMIAGEKITYGTVFRRVRNGRSMAELRTDGIAGCLRTPRGGSGRQILFAAGGGNYAVRLLSPRECARLMGAGEFRIADSVTLNQALFGFGDAVCVPVIEWIAAHYLRPLVREDAPSSGKRHRLIRYGNR